LLTSRILELLLVLVNLLWSLSCLSSKESCSTRESFEVPSMVVFFPPGASLLGGGISTFFPSFNIALQVIKLFNGELDFDTN
jgi:hypothetical protein